MSELPENIERVVSKSTIRVAVREGRITERARILAMIDEELAGWRGDKPMEANAVNALKKLRWRLDGETTGE